MLNPDEQPFAGYEEDLRQELAYLYERRTLVESLIQSLERFTEVLSQTQGSKK